MKKIAVSIAAVILCGSLAACSGKSGTSGTSSQSPSVSHTPSLNEVFNSNYPATKKVCTLYFSLVDQGWTDPEIYTQLADGGAFDSYPGSSGSTMFHALIKWCYAH